MKDKVTDEDVVKQMFLRTFSRPPSSAETAKAVAILKTISDKKEGATDLMWALLSSRKFYFNH